MRCICLIVLALVLLDKSAYARNSIESKQAGSYPLRIIHFNDNHARVEPADSSANVCKNATACFGGYARMKTAVDQLRSRVTGDKLVLHAGDAMSGTLWDFVYTRNNKQVQPQFINSLGIDAFTLG